MNTNSKLIETAIFGGGCFWCTEAVFKMLKGVLGVRPGYAGGSKENPTYGEVSKGNTGHAEVIEIKFDPSLIKFKDLLTVFFASHDPTTLNRQGADVGSQYRSAIFYTDNQQKEEAEQFIKGINESSKEGATVVTEVSPLDKFYEAESYHQDYYDRNKGEGYCEIVINPKLEKVQKNFDNLLKENSRAQV